MTTRPHRQLADQAALVELYLRSIISPAEAYSMGIGGGFRPSPCGGCGKFECDACSADPREQVRAHRTKHQHNDPTYVREVINRSDAITAQFPLYLRQGVKRHFALLPPREQLVLRLAFGGGYTDDLIGRHLKFSTRTVQRTREHALESLALRIWRNDGSPRFEEL